MQINRRNLILVVVIILLNGGAFVVLYKGLFKDQVNVLSVQTADVEANQADIIKILPYGTKMDFSILKDRTPTRATYERGKRVINIRPDEVGIDPKTFITQPQANNPAGEP